MAATAYPYHPSTGGGHPPACVPDSTIAAISFWPTEPSCALFPLVLRDDGLLWPLVESLSAIDIDWLGGNNAGSWSLALGGRDQAFARFFLRSPMSPRSPLRQIQP